MKQNSLFKCFHDSLGLCFVCFFQIDRNIVHTLAVGNRNHDVFIHMTLSFVYLFDYRIGNGSHTFSLTLEQGHSLLESLFGQIVLLLVTEVFFAERNFHSQCLKNFHLGIFIIRLFNGIHTTVPNHVDNIHTDTFSHQGMTAFRIYYGTLLVHHVIVFKQTLTNTEVVFFYLLLGTFDRLGYHAVFNHFTFLESHLIHPVSQTVGSEQTHQVIFQRNEEHRRTRVTLTSCTTTQLTVYTT